MNVSPLSESQSQGNSQRTRRSRSAGGSSLQFTLSPGGSNSQQLSQESAAAPPPPGADSTRDEGSAAPSYSKTQLTSMKVADLAQLCSQRGIAVEGTGQKGLQVVDKMGALSGAVDKTFVTTTAALALDSRLYLLVPRVVLSPPL